MTAIPNCLKHELQDAQSNYGHLEELAEGANAIVWYCFQLPAAGDSVGKQSAASLGRLLLDSSVSVEQALMCTLRGQPRLGWASLRLAAEALKDLDTIDRLPDLHPLWLNIGKCTTDEQARAAMGAFNKLRKQLEPSPVTLVCQACMNISSRFGSHANATSWQTVGPVSEVSPDSVGLPTRLRDPTTVRFHIRHLMFHGGQILTMLTDFRIKHLQSQQKELLLAKHAALFAALQKALPDIGIVELNS
ncbi:MAG: hypothetical protein DHS20C15_34860 [Planctomycetota bacterium]|nr:MAG: hypothetical protein DHS20C15_34860 [Planctomycetota bacterium]